MAAEAHGAVPFNLDNGAIAEFHYPANPRVKLEERRLGGVIKPARDGGPDDVLIFSPARDGGPHDVLIFSPARDGGPHDVLIFSPARDGGPHDVLETCVLLSRHSNHLSYST